MEGLSESLGHSLKGKEAREIVRRIQAQIKEWGLALPEVEPLVLDFGLGKFDEIGETEFWIANEVKGGYCGKFMFMFKGQTCPNHHHKEKLETFFIVKGKVRMEYENEVRILNPGDVLLIHVGKYHRFSALETSLILEVSKPCIGGDSHFQNPAIPYGENYRP
jgi:mannose-6-phosphate isomerase-like protein (cupin superfamily)